MRKIVLFLSIILLSILSTYAIYTETNTSNGYNNPIIDESLNFKAELSGEKVYLSWNTFSKDETFKYYKVIKSQDNSNPVYPENGAIGVISNISETKYIDYKPLVGTNYYRVCAITSDMNRYCSNVIKIYKEKIEQIMCTMDYNPVCGKLNGVEKTFSNKCMLNSSNATYLYSGECKKIENRSPVACTMEAKICPDGKTYVGRTGPNCEFEKCPTTNNDIKPSCTKEYMPVCGKMNGEEKTFSNKCMLTNSNAAYLYSGECKKPTNIQGNNGDTSSSDITKRIQEYNIKLKADKIVNQFIEKIEKNYSETEKRISVLNTVIEKLNKLSSSKPNQKQLIDYIISKLKSKIDEYKGDDLGDIENIFNEIQ